MENEPVQQKSRRKYDHPVDQEFRLRYFSLAQQYQPDPDIASVLRNLRGLNSKKPYGQLQRIVDKQLSRSGVDEIRSISDVFFLHVPAERWPLKTSRALAIYSSAGVVLLDDVRIRRESAAKNLDIRILALHVLLHEIGHAIAGFRIDHSALDPDRLKIRSGVRQEGIVMDRGGGGTNELIVEHEVDFFEALNELINDDLVEEVAREFAQASGFASKSELDRFYQKWRSFKQENPLYAHTERLKNILVAHITRYTGVDNEERVRHALWRAGLEGFNFWDADEEGRGRPLLDDVIGPEFTAKLARLPGSSESFDQLLREYNLESFFERVAIWLKKKGWL